MNTLISMLFIFMVGGISWIISTIFPQLDVFGVFLLLNLWLLWAVIVKIIAQIDP